jgi:hypothetical protein
VSNIPITGGPGWHDLQRQDANPPPQFHDLSDKVAAELRIGRHVPATSLRDTIRVPLDEQMIWRDGSAPTWLVFRPFPPDFLSAVIAVGGAQMDIGSSLLPAIDFATVLVEDSLCARGRTGLWRSPTSEKRTGLCGDDVDNLRRVRNAIRDAIPVRHPVADLGLLGWIAGANGTITRTERAG